MPNPDTPGVERIGEIRETLIRHRDDLRFGSAIGERPDVVDALADAVNLLASLPSEQPGQGEPRSHGLSEGTNLRASSQAPQGSRPLAEPVAEPRGEREGEPTHSVALTLFAWDADMDQVNARVERLLDAVWAAGFEVPGWTSSALPEAGEGVRGKSNDVEHLSDSAPEQGGDDGPR